MKNNLPFFTPDSHLSEEGIALWVDALADDRIDKLPKAVLNHVEECIQCKSAIVEVRSMIRELKMPNAVAIPQRKGIIRSLYSKKSTLVRLAAVALVLVTLGTPLGFYIFSQRHTPDKLFSQNFTPYQDLITEKSTTWDDDTIHQLMHIGFEFYQKSNYDSAVVVFKILYEKDPTSDTIAFYLANSVLATKQPPAAAIEILTSLTAKETAFNEQSRWYLAMAFLKNNEPERARQQLNLLRNISDSYKEKAATVLHVLN